MDVKKSVTNVINLLKGSYGAAKVPRRPLIGICVGHSRKGDSGAQSVSGASEWQYNKKLTEYLRVDLENRGVNCAIFTMYDGSGYGGAMRWIKGQLEMLHVDFSVELHFNCADTGLAKGYEFLYWGTSKKGKIIADSFSRVFKDHYPDHLNRGNKGLNGGDRGALFTSLPSMPSVILEPFFGSNQSEWETFGNDNGMRLLSRSYAEAIVYASVALGL